MGHVLQGVHLTKFEIEYFVRFRAFFITFGEISGKREMVIATPVPIPAQKLFDFSDRGLKISLRIK